MCSYIKSIIIKFVLFLFIFAENRTHTIKYAKIEVIYELVEYASLAALYSSKTNTSVNACV